MFFVFSGVGWLMRKDPKVGYLNSIFWDLNLLIIKHILNLTYFIYD
jgi:hypothetical protein